MSIENPIKKEIIIDGVVFKNPTTYSIPDNNGNFSKIHANPETPLHIVDENGNVGLLKNDSTKRAINRLDSYLKPLWVIPNLTIDTTQETGLKITKLAKVDSEGRCIEKGELYLMRNGKVEYDLEKKN